MWLLLLPLKLRYILLSTALLGLAGSAALAWQYAGQIAVLLLTLIFFGLFSMLGLRDFFQTRHAILRNYPITAHLRFLFEKIRPEMRQYFFEDDKDGLPFPRDKRAIVYQRAKGALDKRPFNTMSTSPISSGCSTPLPPRNLRVAFSVLTSAGPIARSPTPPRSSTSRP